MSTGSARSCWCSRRWRCSWAGSSSGTPSRCWWPAAPARSRCCGCWARPAARSSARSWGRRPVSGWSLPLAGSPPARARRSGSGPLLRGLGDTGPPAGRRPRSGSPWPRSAPPQSRPGRPCTPGARSRRGLGALALLVGLMALGPVLAPLLGRAVGLPATRLAGLVARLARDNVVGAPKRSAATMGALVGLTLAAGTGVLAASATRSVHAGIRAASNADLYLEGGLPLTAVSRLAALPEVAAALPLDTAHVRLVSQRVGVDGVDPQAADRVLNLDMRSGSVRALDRPGGGVLVSARLATDHGWRLGSMVAVGMTARQLASMVGWKSFIIAVSGALLGTTLGGGLGAALASAITAQQAGTATIVPPASSWSTSPWPAPPG